MMGKIQKLNFKVLKNQRDDHIKIPNKHGELTLPIAHYALVQINKSSTHLSKLKLVIYGLGSCIALILYDKKSRIYAMSHILLPSSKNINKSIELPLPHKFADYSVKKLVIDFLNLGLKKADIKAIIIGWVNIFQNNFMDISIRNIKSVKKELKALNIKIMKEDTGGTKGRTIVLDTYDDSVSIKGIGNIEYKINL